ncbi:hypothetical protein H8D30_05425 [bacterium]|nr:hypothetical protein [bacterium]
MAPPRVSIALSASLLFFLAGCVAGATPPLFSVNGASFPREWVETYPDRLLFGMRQGLAPGERLPPALEEEIRVRLLDEVVASRQALRRGLRVSRKEVLVAYVRWAGMAFEGDIEAAERYFREQGVLPEEIIVHLRRRVLAEKGYALYMGIRDGDVRRFCEREWEIVVFHFKAYAERAGEEEVGEPSLSWALDYCRSALRQQRASDPNLRIRTREAMERGLVITR